MSGMPQGPDPASAGGLPVGDPADLATALCAIGSVSGGESAIADACEAALRLPGHLDVVRDGNCVVARTVLGRGRRVLVAGHLDTVPQPASGPIDVRVDGGVLHARGAVDMLGGVAALLHTAVDVPRPVHDVTWVLYDCEEVEAARNGLGRLSRERPELLAADVAVLGEPTDLALEGGCQGSVTIEVTVPGRAAHVARDWMGVNAVHEAAGLVARVRDAPRREPEVDGLRYRETLQVVRIDGGGPARNVVPASCRVVINYRFAPDRGVAEALDHLAEVCAGYGWQVLDAAPAARPGLDDPLVRGLAGVVAAHTGRPARAKLGWTDVARFAEMGIPAVNFGPGRPELAHADDERCDLADVRSAAAVLRTWLLGG